MRVTCSVLRPGSCTMYSPPSDRPGMRKPSATSSASSLLPLTTPGGRLCTSLGQLKAWLSRISLGLGEKRSMPVTLPRLVSENCVTHSMGWRPAAMGVMCRYAGLWMLNSPCRERLTSLASGTEPGNVSVSADKRQKGR